MTSALKSRRDHIAFGLAAILAAGGGALLVIPAPRRDVPPFAPPAAETEIAPADTVAPSERIPTPYERLTDRFDLSSLPAPAPPVLPPPDPAAELKRFRFAGSAAAGERQKALFEGNGEIRSLGLGDDLAGFRLMRIDRNAAFFSNEELEVALPLGVSQ